MKSIRTAVQEKGRNIKVMRELELHQRRVIGEDVQSICHKMLNNEFERNLVIKTMKQNENSMVSQLQV